MVTIFLNSLVPRCQPRANFASRRSLGEQSQVTYVNTSLHDHPVSYVWPLPIHTSRSIPIVESNASSVGATSIPWEYRILSRLFTASYSFCLWCCGDGLYLGKLTPNTMQPHKHEWVNKRLGFLNIDVWNTDVSGHECPVLCFWNRYVFIQVLLSLYFIDDAIRISFWSLFHFLLKVLFHFLSCFIFFFFHSFKRMNWNVVL